MQAGGQQIGQGRLIRHFGPLPGIGFGHAHQAALAGVVRRGQAHRRAAQVAQNFCPQPGLVVGRRGLVRALGFLPVNCFLERGQPPGQQNVTGNQGGFRIKLSQKPV